MNVLCTKQMLYYRRPSFSVLELYASYDWWATAPNTHHGLFSIHHFVRISSITWKPWGACNSTRHQTTPLLQRMLCLMLNAAKLAVATYKLRSRANIAVLLYCAQVRMTTNLRAPTTVTTAFLPRLHVSEIQIEVRLTSCCPATIAVSLH